MKLSSMLQNIALLYNDFQHKFSEGSETVVRAVECRLIVSSLGDHPSIELFVWHTYFQSICWSTFF